MTFILMEIMYKGLLLQCIKARQANLFDQRVSDLLCMSNLAHASKMKEHDNNDDFQRITGRAA